VKASHISHRPKINEVSAKTTKLRVPPLIFAAGENKRAEERVSLKIRRPKENEKELEVHFQRRGECAHTRTRTRALRV